MYQVLYRKYRPCVFSDVVGQPQVTKILAGEVAAGRLSHAYLFTGSRGTGKTTCARIFAKAVCCAHPVNGDPCGECETCRGIDNGSLLDYSELDAASNRSIEDIRRIREEAYISPAGAKYRIFVLDEVHMLTNEAFNALLKILEEPPEHVIFILATTDVQKLPGTVLSRCQRFDFVRIDSDIIAKRLMYVAEQEGRVLTADGAALIAGMADGAMRDSLSILDRCMSESGEINADTVSGVTGLVGRDALFRLSDAITQADASLAVKLVNEFHRASCDSERLCTDLLAHFRGYMIAKTVKKPEEILVCTREDLEKFKQRAARIPMDKILFYIDVLSDTAERLRKSTNGRVDAEMAVIRLCSPALSESADALRARIAELESKLASFSVGVMPQMPTAVEVPQTAVPSPGELPAEKPVEQASVSEPEQDFMNAGLPFVVDMPEQPPFEVSPEEDDDIPMGLPFDVPPGEDDIPMGLPFDVPPEEDDIPMGLPFDVPPEEDDDIPMRLPFDMPAEEDDAPPGLPFDTPAVSPPGAKVNLNDSEKAFPYWANVCSEAKRLSPPLNGLVDGSSAKENGDTLILTSVNPLFKGIVAKSDHMVAVLETAVKNITGKAYRIKFV